MAAIWFIGMCGALVVAGALFGAVLVVLNREADLVVQVSRLKAENAGYAADNNILRGRLTRRRNPIVPPQRKAS